MCILRSIKHDGTFSVVMGREQCQKCSFTQRKKCLKQNKLEWEELHNRPKIHTSMKSKPIKYKSHLPFINPAGKRQVEFTVEKNNKGKTIINKKTYGKVRK